MRITRRECLRLGGALFLSTRVPWTAEGSPGGVPVLMYHDISDDYRDAYTISPSLFSAQMEWLYNNGFRAIAVRDIPRQPENGKAVVLTFDDGYASYMEYAFPLFREYGFRSTINVVGNRAGTFFDVGGNRPMLSWDEYRYLLGAGQVDIGCHTFDLHEWNHRGALGVSGRRLAEDLGKFLEVLKKETGKATDILAWPYGLYDGERISIAGKMGFRYLLTSRDDSSATAGKLLEIPRRSVDNQCDIVSLRTVVGG